MFDIIVDAVRILNLLSSLEHLFFNQSPQIGCFFSYSADELPCEVATVSLSWSPDVYPHPGSHAKIHRAARLPTVLYYCGSWILFSWWE